jgi:predicted metal-dependent peptidase
MPALTAEQRLQKAVVDITAHPTYRWMAGIMMLGKRLVDDKIPTACTNGRDEFYGRAFVDSLNDAELRFLVIHEVKHKLYRHLTTWRWIWDEDKQLANMACDYVINAETVDENAKTKFATMTGLLQQGCYDAKYLGWDSARVYRDLQKQHGTKSERAKQGQGPGQPGDGPPVPGAGEPFDEHDWEGAEAMSAEEKRQLARDVEDAIRQGVIAAGKTGTGGDRDFGELLAPQQDWKEIMREFVTTTCAGHDSTTWRKPNRRFLSADMYMPSGISECVGEIVIGPDMSGSIGAAEVTRMLSETKSIAETVKPEAVNILYWDTQVTQAERYEMSQLDNMTQTTTPKGGGGTMVECVPDYMRANKIDAQCAVIFTDGYLGGTFGQWDCPVLWVIVDNKTCQPPFGTVVHVSSGQF